MDPLREPTPDLDGFQLPAFSAPRQAWEEAFNALRRIDLSWRQILEGYGASMATGQGFPDVLALRAWCQRAGLYPADVAAEAILVRISPVVETYTECPDLDAVAQARMALRDLRVERDVLQFVGSQPWNGAA